MVRTLEFNGQNFGYLELILVLGRAQLYFSESYPWVKQNF